jgi:hypothetical protein
MSPVQSARSTRSLVLAALGLTVGIVAVLTLFVVAIPSLTEDGRVQVNLGDERFAAGKAEARAATIDEGGPILFPDVAGGQRDIYLQHLGDDPDAGWLAFDARRPGQGQDCTLVWRSTDDGGEFEDPCDGTTVPADGEGLVAYPVELDEDGNLTVDLNAAARERERDRDGEPDGSATDDGA